MIIIEKVLIIVETYSVQRILVLVGRQSTSSPFPRDLVFQEEWMVSYEFHRCYGFFPFRN